MKRAFPIFLFISLISTHIVLGQGSFGPEKVIVTTDRDVYIAGESILLKTLVYSQNLTAKTPSNICYVLLRDANNTYCRIYLKTAPNNTGTSSIYIPDTLKTGYYELVAFTSYMRNFGEELYFRKQIMVVNRFDEWLTNLFQQGDSLKSKPLNQTSFNITTEKDSFAFRQKVKLKFVPVDNGKQFKDFTVSVRRLNPYSSYDNSCNHQNSSSALPYPENVLFAPERDGIYLTGKVISSDSLPVANESLFLCTPDTVANLQYTRTNSSGSFKFLLNDYHLGKQLIIKTEQNRNGRYSILLDDKFKLTMPFVPVHFGLTPDLRKYIQESRNIVRIQKSYGIVYFKTSPTAEKIKLPHVFVGSSAVVNPADFVELENFKEISDNILPGTRIKTENGNHNIYMLNKADKYFFQKPAAVFLDGVYAYDLKMVMNYSSPLISKIELLPSSRVMGDLTFSGIVSINSATKLKSFDFDPGTCILNMPSISQAVTYLSPNYAYRSVKDPMPDLRQLLYWSTLTSAQDIEFYTSDIPGEYLIEVEAVSNDGNIQKAFSTFKVSGQ